jgi:hypothetical protein
MIRDPGAARGGRPALYQIPAPPAPSAAGGAKKAAGAAERDSGASKGPGSEGEEEADGAAERDSGASDGPGSEGDAAGEEGAWPAIDPARLDDFLDRDRAGANPFDTRSGGTAPYSRAQFGEFLERYGGKNPYDLPMYADGPARSILEAIAGTQFLLIRSATGSGKSVIAPKLLARYAAEAGKRPVVMTTPKRVTTEAAAEFAAEMEGLGRAGAESGVGFAHRNVGSRFWDPRRNRLVYSTDGWLLRQATGKRGLAQFSGVIVDEVHERSIPTDFLMMELKRHARKDPSFRVIVMSATVDDAPYRAYFPGLRVVDVSGSPTFPISQTFKAPRAGKEYLEAAVDEVLRIHRSPPGDPGSPSGILVFVPTKRDCVKGCTALVKACKAGGIGSECALFSDADPGEDPEVTLFCHSLFSDTPKSFQESAMQSARPGTRSVVFATNVAESSITIKDLGYVIDTGLEYARTFDPAAGVYRGGLERVSKAQWRQRIGRVGRTAPGEAVMVYSKSEHAKTPDYPAPSISQTDVADELFRLAASRPETGWPGAVADSRDLMTPVSPAQAAWAEFKLRTLGILAGPPGSPSMTRFGEACASLSDRGARASVDGLAVLAMADAAGLGDDAAFLVAFRERADGNYSSLWMPRPGSMGSAPGQPPPAVAERELEEASDDLAVLALREALAEAEAAARASAGPDGSRARPEVRGLKGSVVRDVRESYGKYLAALADPSRTPAPRDAYPANLIDPAKGSLRSCLMVAGFACSHAHGSAGAGLRSLFGLGVGTAPPPTPGPVEALAKKAPRTGGVVVAAREVSVPKGGPSSYACATYSSPTELASYLSGILGAAGLDHEISG